MQHTIVALVENRFGVLARIAGLFSARGFNIESLAVGETDEPTISRMTIVVSGDDRTLEQIKKQLHKLIDVITVFDLAKRDFIDRELALVKVASDNKKRDKIIETAETLEGKVLHVGPSSVTLEIVGDTDRVASAIKLFKEYGIKEIVRTGRIALEK